MAKTLDQIQDENTEAALRGDPALLYALLQWARRTREGVSEADLAETREAGERLGKDRQSKGALGELRAAMGSGAKK